MSTIWSHDQQHAYIDEYGGQLADLARRAYADEGRGWVAVWPGWIDPETGAVGDKLDFWTETTMPAANRCLLHAVRAHDPAKEYVVAFVYPIDGDDEDVAIDWCTVPLPTVHVGSRGRQLRVLGGDPHRLLDDHHLRQPREALADLYRSAGLSMAPFSRADMAALYRMHAAGYSDEEARAFVQGIVDRAIAQQAREREN
jgi:hypothetical protein